MENGINGLHREGLLNLNDEKVDHFLIRLQQVDRVIALANQNLTILAGQKLDELLMYQGRVPELEGTVDKGNVVGVVLGQHLLVNLHVSEDLVGSLFAVDFKGLETGVGEILLIAL